MRNLGLQTPSSRCGCNLKTTTKEVCDMTGKCKCKRNFQGATCDECKRDYYSYPLCTVCDCKSGFGTCGKSGECICYKGYTGRSCDKCAEGYYGFPRCTECACNPKGSHSLTCDRVTGKCQCKINVVGDRCGECAKDLVGFPACQQCSCNPIGTRALPGGGKTCFGVEDMRCLCKGNVKGKTCDRCRIGFYDFSAKNPSGCSPCACSTRGSLPGLRDCNFTTGTCSCKSYVTGDKCHTCKNGTYGMMSRDLFGCRECSCNPGGSINSVCNKNTGQCQCRPTVHGRSCNRISSSSKTYYPTLYHIRAELEDAVGDDGIPVLAGSEQSAFPSFSGAGYVIPPVHMVRLGSGDRTSGLTSLSEKT
ncbi:hypothetical protein QZH41_014770 [Actinostola sp. cb2023]|nr:hypothetical protein QZH41_014770 [Actinostola sp. cb2023]